MLVAGDACPHAFLITLHVVFLAADACPDTCLENRMPKQGEHLVGITLAKLTVTGSIEVKEVRFED